jgi:hypothetical protein
MFTPASWTRNVTVPRMSHRVRIGALCLALAVLLNACSQARMPIYFTKITVSPDPAVGQIVNLHIEVTSKYDEPEVTFTVDFLEQYNNRVNYLSGTTRWVGPMAVGETKAFDLTICVWEEGDWPIEIYAKRTAGGDAYQVGEQIFLESRVDRGKLLRFPEFAANRITPTPRPFPVSPECSGKTTQ